MTYVKKRFENILSYPYLNYKIFKLYFTNYLLLYFTSYILRVFRGIEPSSKTSITHLGISTIMTELTYHCAMTALNYIPKNIFETK